MNGNYVDNITVQRDNIDMLKCCKKLIKTAGKIGLVINDEKIQYKKLSWNYMEIPIQIELGSRKTYFQESSTI